MKAYRTVKGRIVLFRPQKNGQRLSDGARRLMIPPLPMQVFLEAVGLAVRENADWVPPCGEGALYLRPLLFGSGADLGVKPSSEYTLVIYVSPVGQYFGPGTVGARMQLCKDHHRAAPFGIGHVKAAGNYAQCFSAQREAKADGFSDVIYLDVGGTYIEEAAASNFFCVDSNRVIHTPQLGTILPGVTRDSIITLARRLRDEENIQLNVGKVSLSTALNATEAFLTGTGAGITPVEHISSGDESADFQCPGPVAQMLSQMLSDIQQERVEDKNRWLHDPFTERMKPFDSFVEPIF
jgi:branched-chain amino acid aminotransferase